MSQDPSRADGVDPSAELQRARAALDVQAGVTDLGARRAMLSALEHQVAREQTSWTGRLRQKPTLWRRLAAMAALGLIVVFELSRHAVSAFSVAPLRVALSLALMGALMFAVLWTSLRPLHVPALSRRAELGWVGGSVLCAWVISLWPSDAGDASMLETLRGAWPCFAYGSMVALAVYLVVRVLDRSSWISGMLAAVASGLGANFVLMTHCPSAGPDHMLFGHFAVIAAFVAGYGLWSRRRAGRAGRA